MKLFKTVIILALTSLLSQTTLAEKCTYTLDQNALKIEWQAFKTMQKLAVNGSFPKFKIKAQDKAQSLKKLAQSISIEVDKTVVETGDVGRNKTIADYFFALVAPQISGKITNFSEKTKELKLSLNLNKIKKNIPLTFELKDDLSFTATGAIDVLAFNATTALESLNKQCYELHKGPDGVSKTWSEVTLKFSGRVVKTCS